jgi:hypothetical protein
MSIPKVILQHSIPKVILQDSIPKVNSSKFSIPRFKWTDCQSHQAKIGSFASNSTPDV